MATGGEAVDYACTFTVRPRGPLASKPRAGALFRIEQKDLEYLLEEPSCLKKKIGENAKELSEQKDCYVFTTTHANVYEPVPAEPVPAEPVPAPTVEEPLIGGKIVFGRSEIPIEENVLLCAVSCCGRNSIMKISPSDTVFTLKPHGSKCHIGYNFVVGFLEASAVKSKIESEAPPPTLSLAQCKLPVTSSGVQYTAHLNWRCVEIEWPQRRVEEEADLDTEIQSFIARRSIAYSAGQSDHLWSDLVAQAGAPVVARARARGRAHTYPLGINAGGEIITFDSIFELLKGGLVPFFAVMTHHDAHFLVPSRWREHILPHVQSQPQSPKTFTATYLRDVLHRLLEGGNKLAIWKISSMWNPPDIISALEIITAIFGNLKNMASDSVMCVDWHCHESGDGCQCVRNMFSSTLKGTISDFSSVSVTNQDITAIVEHLFQCAAAILYCEPIAREFIEENIDALITLAKSENYGANRILTASMMRILLKERDYEKSRQAKPENQVCSPQPETEEGHDKSFLALSKNN